MDYKLGDKVLCVKRDCFCEGKVVEIVGVIQNQFMIKLLDGNKILICEKEDVKPIKLLTIDKIKPDMKVVPFKKSIGRDFDDWINSVVFNTAMEFRRYGYLVVDSICHDRIVMLKAPSAGSRSRSRNEFLVSDLCLYEEDEIEKIKSNTRIAHYGDRPQPVFKVGDLVKVKDRIVGNSNPLAAVANSKKCGQIATVVRNYSYAINNSYGLKFKDDESETGWVFFAQDLELYHTPPQHREYKLIHNDKTIVLIDKNTKRKGIAKCNPEDKFDFAFGVALAKARLDEDREKEENLIHNKY